MPWTRDIIMLMCLNHSLFLIFKRQHFFWITSDQSPHPPHPIQPYLDMATLRNTLSTHKSIQTKSYIWISYVIRKETDTTCLYYVTCTIFHAWNLRIKRYSCVMEKALNSSLCLFKVMMNFFLIWQRSRAIFSKRSFILCSRSETALKTIPFHILFCCCCCCYYYFGSVIFPFAHAFISFHCLVVYWSSDSIGQPCDHSIGYKI